MSGLDRGIVRLAKVRSARYVLRYVLLGQSG